MPLTLLLCLLLIIVLAFISYSSFNKKHILGFDAKEQKVNVVVLNTQIVEIPNTQPGEENQEYWIYVQKQPMGPKREFKVGIHYFHALSPGDKGVLTYCGDKFQHFAKTINRD
ncbi:DUF2500 domain-containing protein [Vibrio sp. S11_S32]|uniref:DUF2500 domain-containing protein n=1 Tax=Vibrio sp. S11_S32 TaxID=2720225 RepID=UPI001680BBA4|nr:DUF2500 domain-containing protein [Vibrio sp. S11_S32]MBD1576441.1 DUF2500 domain-containing protein [Vibrio sp. S11_S32]